MLAAPHPPALSIAVGVLLVALLVPATVVDLRERRIPNVLTAPAALVALVLGLALDPGGQSARIAAATATVIFLLAVRGPRPDGLGLGDVKLAGVLGLALGPVVVVALGVAFAAGAVVAATVALRGGRHALRTTTVPFGPYLAGGSAMAFASGQPMLAAYLGFAGLGLATVWP
jgi:leader peptidase (prepilin peptidase)/N-methyltransferase